jgi:hypothetical protein
MHYETYQLLSQYPFNIHKKRTYNNYKWRFRDIVSNEIIIFECNVDYRNQRQVSVGGVNHTFDAFHNFILANLKSLEHTNTVMLQNKELLAKLYDMLPQTHFCCGMEHGWNVNSDEKLYSFSFNMDVCNSNQKNIKLSCKSGTVQKTTMMTSSELLQFIEVNAPKLPRLIPQTKRIIASTEPMEIEGFPPRTQAYTDIGAEYAKLFISRKM